MNRYVPSFAAVSGAALLLACGPAPAPSASPSPGPRIVQPGAPGQASRTITTEELDGTEGVRHTPADVRFMQGMIPHHAQALEMTALVRENTGSEAIRRMALRMEISQADEIMLMESWLRDRGEPVRMPMEHGTHGMHRMPGMLSPEQMDDLRRARGVEFDRLFLEYMIQHHEGALIMVGELFRTPGAGQESTVFKFAEEVDADQAMEIERMQRILDQLNR